MSAPVMTIHDEETTDPFADVDDAFPQEGWRRQKEDKEDGVLLSTHLPQAAFVEKTIE